MQSINLVLLFSALSFFGFSQNFLPRAYDTVAVKQSFTLEGEGFITTSSIENQLTSKFIFGGNIDSNMITSTLERHKPNNRVGMFADPSFKYRNYNVRLFKNKNWGMQIEVGMVHLTTSQYASDLFGLAMQGNARYLGETLNFSNTTLNIFSGHKIGFGLVDAKTKSYVSLNVIGLRNYTDSYIQYGEFTFDEDGYGLTATVNGEFTTTSQTTYYKGLGLGMDAVFILPIQAFKRTSYLQFSVKNLGASLITSNVYSYQVDTSITHNGFQLSQLVGEESYFKGTSNIYDQLGVQRDTTQDKVVAMPFSIHIGKIVDEVKDVKLQSFYGIRVYGQEGALPLVYLGGHYAPNDYFQVGAHLSYGGFTALNGGIYLHSDLGRLNLGISAGNIVGTLSKRGLGHAYSLRINYTL